MREIILNLAVSIDGYICDEQGGFDWIVGHGDNSSDTGDAFDFEAFNESVDLVVMGSKAYEDCILSGLTMFEGKKIVVATSRDLEPRGNVEFINGDICQAVLAMKKEKGKNIWLFGGAGLTDHFIRDNVVDQYIIGIIPTILGNGRRLFKGNYGKIDLLLDSVLVNDGITMLFYSKR